MTIRYALTNIYVAGDVAFHNHLEACCIARPGDAVVTRGRADDGAITVFYPRDGVLTAAAALNRSKDVKASMRLIARGVTPPPDILSDPQADLREIERETV
jgi:Reductase C-terminal